MLEYKYKEGNKKIVKNLGGNKNEKVFSNWSF